VIATPVSAIAPPTAVKTDGTSPSAIQPTSAATGGTAYSELAAAMTSMRATA